MTKAKANFKDKNNKLLPLARALAILHAFDIPAHYDIKRKELSIFYYSNVTIDEAIKILREFAQDQLGELSDIDYIINKEKLIARELERLTS